MSAKKRHHQNTLILGLVASLGGLAVPAQAQDAATKKAQADAKAKDEQAEGVAA